MRKVKIANKDFIIFFNTPSACGGVSASSLSLRERVRVRGNIID